jgi:hypothetical protein
MEFFVGRTICKSRPVKKTASVTVHEIDVLQMPQGYVVRNVQAFRKLIDEPIDVNSTVLVFKENDFSAKVVAVLEDNLSSTLQPRSAKIGSDGTPVIAPGEKHFESKGGAYAFLGNQGNAILSGRIPSERVECNSETGQTIVQGRDVRLCNANNFDTTVENLELPIPNPIIASVRVDRNDNIILVAKDSVTQTEIAKIKIDPLGKISLENIFGAITLSRTGEISIEGPVGTFIIDALGNVSIKGLSIELGNVGRKLFTEAFASIFLSHKHAGVQTGTGFSGTSVDATNVPITAAQISPTLTVKTKAE